jgi:hypothetical protein
MSKIIAGIVIFVVAAPAQYVVPFASRDNLIELTVENASAFRQEHITVEAVDVPSCVSFTSARYAVKGLGELEKRAAIFRFSVDKSAPVGREHVLALKVSTPAGQSWTKEIRFSVAAPEKFELFQNYPNPFNPTTKIDYQLPFESLVRIELYSITGERIAELINSEQAPGYYTVELNSARLQLSSGVYIYSMKAVSKMDSKSYIQLKKMVVLK